MKKSAISFVIFGGTGDLARRKLVPAFASLVKNNLIDSSSTVIGLARKNFNDKSYKKFLIESLENEDEKKFLKNLSINYVAGDFSKRQIFAQLKDSLKFCEIGGCNRIYYLATSYSIFPFIVKEIKEQNLLSQKKGFTRIAFEKPFGKDLKSAIKLDRGIHKIFSEGDIYRIDHYLAKETVQNIHILKFTNPILEAILNNKFVESVEVIADENLGVGNRLKYYNDTGAIKDMIQSHMLQVLALILVDRPKKITQENIDEEKVKILRALEILPAKLHLLGQYKSYRTELKKENLKNRKAETFAKIMLNCKTKKWDKVKISLRTGKRLNKKTGKIIVNFKQFESQKKFAGDVGVNKIIINIFPTQNVDIIMNTLNPNLKIISPVKFEFCKECEFGPNSIDEYALFLEEMIKGEKTLFASSKFIIESWKVIEKIMKIKDKIKFITYKDYSHPENLK